MFDAFVINMDHRTDRWESMQSNWSHIFKLHRVPGVKSQKKYHGCGQAHVNAFKEARKRNPHHPFYIVMEDDVKPLKAGEYYIEFLNTLFSLQEDTGIDCISLNSTFDKRVSTESFLSHPFLPDLLYVDPNMNLLSGASFMIYSQSISKHMEEYQAHLNASFFILPNDRLFSTRYFGLYTFRPWRCFIAKEMVCDLNDLAKTSDNFGGGAFHDYAENLTALVKNSKKKLQSVPPSFSLQITNRLFNKISILIFMILLFLIYKVV